MAMAPLAFPVSILASANGTAVVAMPSLYLSTLRVGNDPGHGSDMKLAQILATLDAFGLHARGSATLTDAPGRADRLDKA
jgi:hypothetical protein